jgi:hypothetical protein
MTLTAIAIVVGLVSAIIGLVGALLKATYWGVKLFKELKQN